MKGGEIMLKIVLTQFLTLIAKQRTCDVSYR